MNNSLENFTVLMKPDAELHNKKPGQALGIQLKRGRRDYMSKYAQAMMGKPTAEPNNWKFTDSGLVAGEPA